MAGVRQQGRLRAGSMCSPRATSTSMSTVRSVSTADQSVKMSTAGPANGSSSRPSNRWVSRSTSAPNSRRNGSGCLRSTSAAAQTAGSHRPASRMVAFPQVAWSRSVWANTRPISSSNEARTPSSSSRSVRIAPCPSRTDAPPRVNSPMLWYSSSRTRVRRQHPGNPCDVAGRFRPPPRASDARGPTYPAARTRGTCPGHRGPGAAPSPALCP